MQQRLVLEFAKMHGAGNDFIVLDNRFYYFSDDELSALARRLCPRRTGIGADGLLALSAADRTDVDFRMRYVNADGSVGSMCGNGARCLAWFARRAGIEKNRLRFSTDAGVHTAVVTEDPEAPVRVHMPDPVRFQPGIVSGEDGLEGVVHGIWTGVPHAVCFVPDVEAVALGTLGPRLRFHEAFPEGANVDVVEVVRNGTHTGAHIKARTYERGVEAETLACGTGALAAALVTHLTGQTEATTVSVSMPGGTLTVGFERQGDAVRNLYLEGPAVLVYRGTVEV